MEELREILPAPLSHAPRLHPKMTLMPKCSTIFCIPFPLLILSFARKTVSLLYFLPLCLKDLGEASPLGSLHQLHLLVLYIWSVVPSDWWLTNLCSTSLSFSVLWLLISVWPPPHSYHSRCSLNAPGRVAGIACRLLKIAVAGIY